LKAFFYVECTRARYRHFRPTFYKFDNKIGYASH
jgi:hypothetical protein